MIRKTFITLLSLAAVGTLAAGVVSYWRGLPADTLCINGAEERADIRIAVIDGNLHAVQIIPDDKARGTPRAGDAEKKFGPFYVRRVLFGKVTASGIGGPIWVLFAILAACPLTAWWRGPFLRRRRRRRHQCIRCGYNLTGLTEPRCPECGTAYVTRQATHIL